MFLKYSDEPYGEFGSFRFNFIHSRFSTDTVHNLYDQTEADEISFQFAAQRPDSIRIRFSICFVIDLVFPLNYADFALGKTLLY